MVCQMAIVRRETEQVESANASGRTPVVFIHGLWLLPSSWQRWAEMFEEAGYAAVTPTWPGDPETVEEARAHPEVFAGQTVGQVAERHPGLKLIIDHYGRNRAGMDDEAHANQPVLLGLAKYPNVAVKATGAPGNSSQAYPFKNIHKYTEQIFDAFGPQRIFWGTDITRMPCSWRQCVTMFTEEMPFLKGRDLELVMGRALCEWLEWPT